MTVFGGHAQTHKKWIARVPGPGTGPQTSPGTSPGTGPGTGPGTLVLLFQITCSRPKPVLGPVPGPVLGSVPGPVLGPVWEPGPGSSPGVTAALGSQFNATSNRFRHLSGLAPRTLDRVPDRHSLQPNRPVRLLTSLW